MKVTMKSFCKAARCFSTNIRITLCVPYNKSTDVLSKYKEFVDWKKLSHAGLSEDFVLANSDSLDVNRLFKNKIYFSLIDRFAGKMNRESWVLVSESDNIPYEILDKYPDKLDWSKICSRFNKTVITSELLERVCHYFNKKAWIELCYKQALSETFIEKYFDNLTPYNVSSGQKLSPELIEKFLDELDWMVMPYKQTLSENIIKKKKHVIDWAGVCGHQKLSETFIKQHKDFVIWSAIFRNQKLSEEFIREFLSETPHLFSWKGLEIPGSCNDFIYFQGTPWYVLTKYQQLSEQFWLDYIGRYKDNYVYISNIFNHQKCVTNEFIGKIFSHLNENTRKNLAHFLLQK